MKYRLKIIRSEARRRRSRPRHLRQDRATIETRIESFLGKAARQPNTNIYCNYTALNYTLQHYKLSEVHYYYCELFGC